MKIQQLRDRIGDMEPDELRTELRRSLFHEAENYARWQEATGRIARVEGLRATMPHALDCDIPCTCWKRWVFDALTADSTEARS